MEYDIEILNDGTTYYYKKGTRVFHRENGPAVEFDFGSKIWYINGKRHRIGGPAVDWNGGTKEWWFDGKLHRTNGPAIEWTNDYKEWWINGEQLSPEKEIILNKWWDNKKQ